MIARPSEVMAYAVCTVVVIVVARLVDRWRGWRYAKQPIAGSIRRAVLDRDGRCRNPWCRSKGRLEVDHVFPERRGGRATLSNLQALCRRCNAVKGARVRHPLIPRVVWWAVLTWRANR